MSGRALAGAVALCVATAALCVVRPPLLFDKDAVHYLALGAALARGDGYASGMHFVHDLLQPPLYPLLVALLMKLGLPVVVAGVAVMLGAQAATVVALVGIHRAAWGRGAGYTALAAALSTNVALGAHLTLEPLFVCALAWGFRLAVASLRRDRLAPAAGAGLALGLGLLTRSEVVLTIAVVGLLLLAWPSPWRRRLGRAALFGAALGSVALPYGLWMRARLGSFEVLPKVRYNLALPSLVAHMELPPEAGEDAALRLATLGLMPDHRTFVLDHAFAHPEFDPRTVLPQRGAARGERALAFAAHSIERVLADGALRTGFLNPLALGLMALALWSARARGSDGGRRRIAFALAGAAALHALPAIAAGDDFQERYLCATLLFSTPLVGGGAAALADLLARRMRPRVAAALVAATLALVSAGFTLRLASRLGGGPSRWPRMRALEAACRRDLPAGARVLDTHPRAAFLRGATSIALPFARSDEELLDYLAAWHVGYALLDARELRGTGNPVDAALLDPRRWPRGWRLIEELSPGADPIRIVALDGAR